MVWKLAEERGALASMRSELADALEANVALQKANTEPRAPGENGSCYDCQVGARRWVRV
jgi:hypothetical protein